jgi:biotin synthase
MEFARLAEKAIKEERLTAEECQAVLHAPDDEILVLLAAAYSVRKTFCGKTVHLHVLMNAKSGLCPEDCGYCSQSSLSTADISKYALVSRERLLEAAKAAKESKAKRFCIVTSGRGATWREIEYLSEAVRGIRDEVGIKVCCCVGLLDEPKAKALKDAGVDRLNHNLNTSEEFYSQICSSHTYQDRVDTLQAARSAGLSLCTGAIFGMGESDDDVIETLMALRDLAPESIPINFLIPIEGTPLQNVHRLTPYQCLRILCLARFLNPRQEIRISGGREFHLRSLQAMSLYPANSLFVEGYLTTPGQSTKDAWRLIEDMGFEIQLD